MVMSFNLIFIDISIIDTTIVLQFEEKTKMIILISILQQNLLHQLDFDFSIPNPHFN